MDGDCARGRRDPSCVRDLLRKLISNSWRLAFFDAVRRLGIRWNSKRKRTAGVTEARSIPAPAVRTPGVPTGKKTPARSFVGRNREAKRFSSLEPARRIAIQTSSANVALGTVQPAIASPRLQRNAGRRPLSRSRVAVWQRWRVFTRAAPPRGNTSRRFEEAARIRRGGATKRPFRCAPWARGRATDTCPRGRPAHANR